MVSGWGPACSCGVAAGGLAPWEADGASLECCTPRNPRDRVVHGFGAGAGIAVVGPCHAVSRSQCACHVQRTQRPGAEESVVPSRRALHPGSGVWPRVAWMAVEGRCGALCRLRLRSSLALCTHDTNSPIPPLGSRVGRSAGGKIRGVQCAMPCGSHLPPHGARQGGGAAPCASSGASNLERRHQRGRRPCARRSHRASPPRHEWCRRSGDPTV